MSWSVQRKELRSEGLMQVLQVGAGDQQDSFCFVWVQYKIVMLYNFCFIMRGDYYNYILWVLL